MNTLGLLQRALGFTLTLQETQSIHDSMNIPKIFITYVYILHYQSSINFQFLPNLAFELNQTLGRFLKSQSAKYRHLTSWLWAFNITQKSVNKQPYWIVLTLVRSNGLK